MQLLRYDGILAQKEQELQQVKKILELRELELARLKASFLTEAAIPGFCKDSRATRLMFSYATTHLLMWSVPQIFILHLQQSID